MGVIEALGDSELYTDCFRETVRRVGRRQASTSSADGAGGLDSKTTISIAQLSTLSQPHYYIMAPLHSVSKRQRRVGGLLPRAVRQRKTQNRRKKCGADGLRRQA